MYKFACRLSSVELMALISVLCGQAIVGWDGKWKVKRKKTCQLSNGHSTTKNIENFINQGKQF